MVELIALAESNGDSLTTSTSLQDKLTLTVPAGDLVGSANYELWAYVESGASVAGNRVVVKLENITDSVVYQDLAPAAALSTYNDNTGQVMQGFYTAPSTPVEVTFKIRFAASVSGNEVKTKNAHIVLTRVDSESYRAESTGKTDNTTAYQAVTGITQTISGRHIAMATLENLMNAGDRPYLRINIDGSLGIAAEITDQNTSSSRSSHSLVWVTDDLSSASHTIEPGTRDTSGFSDAYNKRHRLWKAANLPGYAFDQTATNDTTPATSFESKASITQTWASGVRYLVVATIPARSSNTSSIDVVTELRVDGSAVRTCKTRSRNTFGIQCTSSMCISYILEGDGGEHTVAVGWYFSGSASGNCSGASIVAMQLESSGAILAAGGYALAAGAGIGSTFRLGAGRGAVQSGAQMMAAVAAARVAGGASIATSAAVGGSGTRQAAQAWPEGSAFANGQPVLSAAFLSSGLTLASSLAFGQLAGRLGSNGVAAGGAVDAAGAVAQRAALGVARSTAEAHARGAASLRGSAFPAGLSAADGAAALVAEIVGASGWAVAQSHAFAGGLVSFASSGASAATGGAAGRPFTLRLGTCYLPAASSAAGSPSIPSAIFGAAGWAIADSTAFVGPALSRAGSGFVAGQGAASGASIFIRLAHAAVSSASSAQGRSRTVLSGRWEATSGSSASGEPSILGSLISSGFALGNSFAIGENAIVTITIAPTLPTPAAHQISKRVLDAMRARLIVAWEAAVRDAADGYAVPAADVERLATIDWTGLQRKQVWIGQVDPSTIGGATATVFPAASIAVTGTQHTGIEKFREWSGDVTAQIAIALTWRRASAVPDFDEQADLAEDAMYSTLHDRAWLSAAGHGMTFANSIEARGPIEQTGQHWLQVMLFQFTFEVDV